MKDLFSNDKLDDQKSKQRNRNNHNDRSFICGCGKSYLSYPALYTHLKQKHEGDAPNGTYFPNSNNKGKKGRPKNEEKQIIKSEEDIISLEESNPLEEFLYYLKTLGRNLHKQQQDNIKNYLMINFPCEYFEDPNDYQVIYDLINDLSNMKLNEYIQMQDDEGDSLQNNFVKQTSLNKIFGIFLFEVGQWIDIDAYKEVTIIILLLRKTLNNFGWKIIEKQDKKNQEYCAVKDGEKCLLICEKFIKEYLPLYFSQLKNNRTFQIIGYDDQNIKQQSTHMIIKHFCKWIFEKHYTNQKVEFETDEI